MSSVQNDSPQNVHNTEEFNENCFSEIMVEVEDAYGNISVENKSDVKGQRNTPLRWEKLMKRKIQ